MKIILTPFKQNQYYERLREEEKEREIVNSNKSRQNILILNNHK